MMHMEEMKQTTRPLYNNWGTIYAELCAQWLHATTIERGCKYIFDKIEIINRQMKPWQRQIIET